MSLYESKPQIENCDVDSFPASVKCHNCPHEETCPLHKEIIRKMYEVYEREVAEYGD